jgi:beta-mannosidase
MHPQLPYVSSSPLSNWGRRENFNHHSMHYWGVWHGKDCMEDFDTNIGRFMVEYGFQSYPEWSTLFGSMDASDMDLSSEVMTNRQKSYVGNGLINKFISAYLSPAEDFGDFVEKSQRVQAMAMKRAIRAHVYADPHCMGTLFWQLNDCWPGPSWSVIDHQGRRKQAFQVVKGEFLRADSLRGSEVPEEAFIDR